jgi:hypothetical protein
MRPVRFLLSKPRSLRASLIAPLTAFAVSNCSLPLAAMFAGKAAVFGGFDETLYR